MLKWFYPLLAMTIFLNISLVFAYDNEFVHPAINEISVNISKLNNVLRQLGFNEGIEERFDMDGNIDTVADNLRAWEWISKGGEDEDQSLRPLNHFHDPLKQWESAGLLTYGGMSSLMWAQYPIQEYSWLDARLAYLEALETGDETKFAQMFVALGHLMHLISDKAVPAHVRNDAHPPTLDPDYYESWAKDLEERFNKMTKFKLLEESTNKLKAELYSEFEVSPSIFDNAIQHPSASSPISALWDMDIYVGENPNPAVTWDSDIGLAEFTNANFFSDGQGPRPFDDTIFDGYKHPALEDTDYYEIDWTNPETFYAEDSGEDFRIYLWRKINDEKKYRLVAQGYFFLDAEFGNHYSFQYILDDKVLEDYAKLLVPRAVGYSTSLLNYFFRGDIDMVPDPNGYGYIITNNSNEELNGTFALYYDDKTGDRHPVDDGEWELTIGPKLGDAPGESMSVSFTPPTSPAPEQSGQYLLVFHGRMGNEEDAVAGKVIEPPVPYILIAMKTKTHGDLGISSEQLPDIVVVWDMTTNNYARIMNSNGELISFPMEWDDFIASFSNTGIMQFLNYNPLFANYSLLTDIVPNCNVSRLITPITFFMCPSECRNLSSCSYPAFYDNTETDSCSDTSNLPGVINKKSVTSSHLVSVTFEHPYLDIDHYGSGDTYELFTYSGTSSYDEYIELQVAAQDIKLGYSYYNNIPLLFFIQNQRIDVLNNSNAKSIYLNTSLVWNQNVQLSYNGQEEWEDVWGENHHWQKYDFLGSGNGEVQNSFFNWTEDLLFSTSKKGAHIDAGTWSIENRGDGLWNPPTEISASVSTVGNYITGDIAIAGIQSHENEYNQYQVGLFYFSNRKLTNTFNSIYSNNDMNETHELTDVTTDGPIQTEVRAFCSLFPSGETLAEHVNPWTLPMNEDLQNAINQMVQFFAQNYGVDPMAINPSYFDDDMYHEQNIWDREFNVRSIYINSIF